MEYRDLYDKNKQITGKTFLKGEQVPEGYFYLIVKAIIENSNNEFLIQKRVSRKGGKWSLTGGHPKSGESSLEGILTEVEEEIGINIEKENLSLINTIINNDQFYDIYYLKKDIDINDIIIQEEEVDGVMWNTKEDIIKLYENNEFHEGDFKILKETLEGFNI